LVRWSVTFFTPSTAHDISATKRATGDPLVSKRPNFRGLFGFSKKYEFLDFWISGFLDFFGFLAISRQRKELPEVRWCQNDRIFEGFLDFPKHMKFWISGFLDFWISGFVWISGYISATKRATKNPLVSKRPDF